MKKYAVIVAGGNGMRMKSVIPKQFLLINNKPLLYYTIRPFLQAYADIHIILVLGEGQVGLGQKVIDTYFDPQCIRITTGGITRFHSVQNGLKLVEEDSIVFVHDGARCLITAGLIQRCYTAALKSGSAIPVIDCHDSVRMIVGDNNEPIDRNLVRFVQTPQTFHSNILLPAYTTDFREKFTDEATVVEAYGMKVHLVDGEEGNLKITRPRDLILAEQYLME
jgi:2-C-methyl-D-erythritol 4-phosphate cytidylyltransferase